VSTDPHAATVSVDDVGPSASAIVGARYELLALLGSGGMGNVYKARDRELDELVALKVLRPEIAGAPGALERFRRELKLARRVTHANVARVFDIGELGGDRVITMELVVGESLAALVAREGALPVRRVIEIASAIGAGVAAAHAVGVVHRDLKPDNVLLGTDGRTLVTDFGIARVAAGADGDGTVGGIVGTPAYMAPEQVEAAANVDFRADIYALGEILYEMLTGARAWQGDAVFAVAAARLLSPPPDARARCASVDPRLAQLALECMARKPDERPGSMQAVVDVLAQITVGAPISAELSRAASPLAEPSRHGALKRVAVLPFRNTGAPSDEHIADGLTDDLIDLLSMSPGLRVSSRGVVMRRKGTDHDPREVGRELAVQVVIEGTVRRAPGALRIQARLISVADGFQLWAKRFDGGEADLFSLNDRVAREVAAALTVDLANEARGAEPDPEAIDLYMRARERHLSYFGHAYVEAAGLYAQARQRSPDDPRILAGYVMSHAYTMKDDADARLLRGEAERALRLAPSSPDAHVALGTVLAQCNDPGAVVPLLRAIKLQPNNADAHDLLGRMLLEADVVAGVRHVEIAAALEPDMGLPRAAFARHHLLHGDCERADAIIDSITAQNAALGVRARPVLWPGHQRVAKELHDRFQAATQFDQSLRAVLKLAAFGTRFEEGAAVASDRRTRRTLSFLWQLDAEAACFLGEEDRAMRSIERASSLGVYDLAWLDRCPGLERLRDRQDFAATRTPIAARAAAVRSAYEAGA